MFEAVLKVLSDDFKFVAIDSIHADPIHLQNGFERAGQKIILFELLDSHVLGINLFNEAGDNEIAVGLTCKAQKKCGNID